MASSRHHPGRKRRSWRCVEDEDAARGAEARRDICDTYEAEHWRVASEPAVEPPKWLVSASTDRIGRFPHYSSGPSEVDPELDLFVNMLPT